MPKHEFGIMPVAPKKGECYDDYTPWKYRCISVDDGRIAPHLARLKLIRCFWYSLDRPEPGLAYDGITLIPPEAVSPFLDVIAEDPALSGLGALLIDALESRRFVIHYGI